MSIIFTILIIVIAITLGFIVFWKFYFLRNPDRNTPTEPVAIVSPADGKIVAIHEYNDNSITFYKGEHKLLGHITTITSDVAKSGYILSIFMSPLDVHYNRAPITGTVKSVRHRDGKFKAVNTFEAGLVNEKAEILIEGKIKLKMIQIAGFLARRIRTDVKASEKVEAGQLVGLINLGSQVTLVLPKSVKLIVNKGDRVIAGETILAKINS